MISSSNNMSAGFSFSCFTSLFYLLLFVAVFRLCLSINNGNDALCNDDERQALVEFKHGLIDEAGRLASWVGEKSDCCKWAGIFCDNITGHVHKIHLPAKCRIGDFDTIKEYEFFQKQRLRGDLSPSLLHLKHLKHLDLSCNDFGGTKVPSFMGSLGSLRYLNLSRSRFHGSIPSQLGNLSELRVLSLGSFYDDDTDEYESTDMRNIEWLSSLRWLHHLDMSGVDLSKAIDWLQVINTLPSLFHLYMSRCQLSDIHPHVYSLNLTSVTSLYLSRNNFNNSLVPRWIFSISSLVSLDLSWCNLSGPVPSGSGSFYNLTSLKLLHVPGNNIMNSSLVFEEISSSVGGSLISLDISSCGVLSLDSLHNMTSLLNLQMYGNQLTEKVPVSLGNLCNLRHIDLGGNNFRNISLKCLLESFFKCKSPSLEYLFLESSGLSSHLPDELGQMIKLVLLQLGNNNIASVIPDSIGRLSFLKYLLLDENLISGPVPYSIGGLSSLEVLDLSNNRINGSLPESLGLLSKLETLDLSHNLLSGVVTEAHFANLNKLKYLQGRGNNLTLRPLLANWIPSFQLVYLELTSWDLGPGFPLWLLQQRELVLLDMSNTRISSTMPLSFWSSLPNLQYLDLSQNNIQGRLFGIPAMLSVLDLSSNRFSGQLPQLSKSSLTFRFLNILDLSNNSFIGSLHHLICPYDGKWMEALNLANNHLSGVIPECWEKYMDLNFLNLENNNLSGGIPRNLGSLSSLESLNMCNNKLSGRLPSSLKKLTKLSILQLAKNKFVGRVPAWLGKELLSLRILNLRSNNFDGNITHELCYLTAIHIMDLAHNNLSGNLPRCFNNFTLLSGKQVTSSNEFIFSSFDEIDILGSASLVIKSRENTYNTVLGLVMILDLSSNNFYGDIPSELMTLKALQSLNLSRNRLTAKIPEKIGDLRLLESFDASFNQLSGELPMSLSSLSFLSSFNVSYNALIGRVPSSTQLQGFSESSFLGNNLCGDPLPKSCAFAGHGSDQEEPNVSTGADWGLIISILFGFIAGFWIVVAPLIVSRSWRVVYFCFLSDTRYKINHHIHKYTYSIFHK